MKKHTFVLITAIIGLLTLSGCSSTRQLDFDSRQSVSSFNSHKAMTEAFSKLEKRIDSGEETTRNDVHAMGFDPKQTLVKVIDYNDIVDKFTGKGNEVAAQLGVTPPQSIITCMQKGKICTAYKVSVESLSSVELPKGSFGTLKSTMNLEERRHITMWKLSVIIVFDGEQAIYAQVEDSIEPNTTVTVEKNSLLKKIGRAITP